MSEWKSKGVIVGPPQYSEGLYNTQYCNVNASEMDLYDIKGDRIAQQMRPVAAYLQRFKGSI
jgi:hypothetical protein